MVLDGSQVENASVRTQEDQIGNSQYVVELILTDSGTQAFARRPGKTLGKPLKLCMTEK